MQAHVHPCEQDRAGTIWQDHHGAPRFRVQHQTSRVPRKHPVAAMSVAKAKVQSIAPVYGASHDAVASKPKAGMVWNVPLFA